MAKARKEMVKSTSGVALLNIPHQFGVVPNDARRCYLTTFVLMQRCERVRGIAEADPLRAGPLPVRFAELYGFLRQNRRRRGRPPKGTPQLSRFNASNTDYQVPFLPQDCEWGVFQRAASKGYFRQRRTLMVKTRSEAEQVPLISRAENAS